MRPSKARYITACQQLLVLGAVLAVLAPAARIVSLDVVMPGPGAASRTPTGAADAGQADRSQRAAAQDEATVPTEQVDAVVEEYQLTPDGDGSSATDEDVAPEEGKTSRGDVPAPDGRAGRTTVTSAPEPVDGFGTIGVTWDAGEDVAADDLTVQARTRTGDEWSEWTEIPYDDDHGPDPGSREGRQARNGTDALIVGEVDEVQVQATASAGVPADMRLAVVAPGDEVETAVEAPAIDTAELEHTKVAAPSGAGSVDPGIDAGTGAQLDAIELQAGSFTPKPQIFSRAQWGADERIRDRSSLRYYEVHAGFVHHTVNANDYTRSQVPGIIRSIYAYHVKSRGWSDIGYNFLVDRFGRIWEGRYGGVGRPVVGAHTLGYNDYAFAMSAIGNFETARPSSAMLDAYARLFAWKLSLHGVDVSSTRQRVGSTYFPAVNGHRDAASTACPGRYLYAKLATIRERAATYQKDWSGREREVDLVSTPHPDLVVRRTSDGAGFVVPTEGLYRLGAPVVASATGWSKMNTILATPDLTGDGRVDLFAREAATGRARVYPGNAAGGFGTGIKATTKLASLDQVTAVGDLDNDGRNDLVARNPSTSRLLLFSGNGDGSFAGTVLARNWSAYDRTVGIGDFDGDGDPDLLGRDGAGALWLIRGTGGSRLGARVKLSGNFKAYNALAAGGDWTGDGRPDLVVRTAGTKLAYVFPNVGGTGFGHWYGPLSGVRGIAWLTSGGDVVGGSPDLVGRRGDALVRLDNAGTRTLGNPVRLPFGLRGTRAVLNVGDWDRDGDGDLATVARYGRLVLRLSNGDGTFERQVIGRGFDKVGLLTAVGDMTGDGSPDLMGQPTGGAMRIYPGRGANGLAASYVAHGAISADRQYGAGRWDPDGAPDSLFRSGRRLVLYPGNGPGGLTDPRSVTADLSPYDWVIAVSDLTGDGHGDLLVRERGTGYLWALPGQSSGLGTRIFLGSGFGAYDLAG